MAGHITLTSKLVEAFVTHNISFFPKLKEGDRFIDTGVSFEPHSQFPHATTMPLGSHSYSLSAFAPCTLIGRYCSIGKGVTVFGDHHPIERLSTSPIFYGPRKYRRATGQRANRQIVPFDPTPTAISIGNDVWIGDNVTFRDGITIGDGSVIAAGSVVTKDVAPYAIVAGNPAKFIKWRFAQELIDALLEIQWWNYNLIAVQALPTEDPEAFLAAAGVLTQGDIVPETRMRITDLT